MLRDAPKNVGNAWFGYEAELFWVNNVARSTALVFELELDVLVEVDPDGSLGAVEADLPTDPWCGVSSSDPSDVGSEDERGRKLESDVGGHGLPCDISGLMLDAELDASDCWCEDRLVEWIWRSMARGPVLPDVLEERTRLVPSRAVGALALGPGLLLVDGPATGNAAILEAGRAWVTTTRALPPADRTVYLAA